MEVVEELVDIDFQMVLHSGCYSAGPSPLGSTALPVSAQAYPISVGAGGTGSTAPTGLSRFNNGS